MSTHSTPEGRVTLPHRPIAIFFAGAAVCSLAAAAIAPAPVQAQAAGSKGTAVYWMTADTASGMGAMGGGGNNAGAMARAMLGGGGMPSHAHTLNLQLGAGQKAAGEPSAEHLPPQGLGAGPSLPLVSPERSKPGQYEPYDWKNMEKPKGRMLIYWGCGERAGPNQPVVIDYESLMSGKTPPAFATMNHMTPPMAGNHPTYGEWPNARAKTHVPPTGSLVGEHVVRGNYTPELRFTVAPANDYLAPVRISGNEATPAGFVPLRWAPVANAKAWLVSTVGAAQNGDMIMWSSSESQAMAMGAAHLSPGEIDRLVKNKVLLPASATSCTIPAEVAKAAPSSMLMTTAFGGEGNYAEPRPANAPKNWKPDWTVKLLTKSTYSGMLGMDMSEMFGGGASSGGATRSAEDTGEAPVPQPQKKKKRNPFGGALGGLGGLIGD